MYSIAANHCDMRQHRKGIDSSNTEAGGLVLRWKFDSNFLNFIYSRHMVKIVCASQDYFQWGIFLAFTCNMRKRFGTQPIRELLDDNKWKIHFPNWYTYSFSASRNKKSFVSICFGSISNSLRRSQCYFY